MLEEKTVSMYARIFDIDCFPKWRPDANYNLWFLRNIQNYCNDLLKCQGYLLLNDVYRELGIDECEMGNVVGWKYDEENPIGDNFVDFGIYEEYNIDAINGVNQFFLLDFNVDGNIKY